MDDKYSCFLNPINLWRDSIDNKTKDDNNVGEVSE